MGWVYIILRTYPFWATPIGVALIFGATSKKSRNKAKKFFYIFLGITLIVTSVIFLFYQGHFKVVPFVHEMMGAP